MMENYITSFQLRFCPAAYLHLEQLPSLWRSILPYLPQWRDSAHLNAALLDEFSLDTDYEEPHGLGALPLQPQSQLETVTLSPWISSAWGGDSPLCTGLPITTIIDIG